MTWLSSQILRAYLCLINFWAMVVLWSIRVSIFIYFIHVEFSTQGIGFMRLILTLIFLTVAEPRMVFFGEAEVSASSPAPEICCGDICKPFDVELNLVTTDICTIESYPSVWIFRPTARKIVSVCLTPILSFGLIPMCRHDAIQYDLSRSSPYSQAMRLFIVVIVGILPLMLSFA